MQTSLYAGIGNSIIVLDDFWIGLWFPFLNVPNRCLGSGLRSLGSAKSLFKRVFYVRIFMGIKTFNPERR